jgi:Heterokaryon incompatibility protein (HET)
MHGQFDEATPRLPTRVIDVTYENPRLVESQGETSQYVALSHCWGKSKTVVTNTCTLSSRKKGIEFYSLPKTFQDAIIVTRRLGYRYLWIDSLCIVQDSHSDWQREAAMMGDYYGGAHLTISATSADGDHVGFLNARTLDTSNPVGLMLNLPNGEIGTIFVVLRPANAVASAFYRDVEQSPTNTRAWILQERALSPRILHYGNEQMFWECRSFELSEDGSIHSRGLSGPQRGFGAKLWMLTDSDHGLKTDDARHENMIRYEWQTLVEAYAKRKLTRPSDKLPAISGLAHRAPAVFRSKYCAGLWESGVRRSLDWVVSNPSEPLEEYRAPSWSWAAVDSKVSFTDERSLNEKTPVFAVEKVDVELLSEDEYGQIKSASLTVRGYLLSLNSTQKPFSFQNKDEDEVIALEETVRATKSIQLEVTDTKGEVVGWVAPDRTPPAPKVLPCLILYRCRDKYGEEYYSAIFLEVVDPEDSPTRFRRFGRGSVWDIDIESASEQSIVLI